MSILLCCAFHNVVCAGYACFPSVCLSLRRFGTIPGYCRFDCNVIIPLSLISYSLVVRFRDIRKGVALHLT